LPTQLAIRVVCFDLISSLMPPGTVGFDNPGKAGAICANAKCLALMFNANFQSSH
jgi:hypothetical protein